MSRNNDTARNVHIGANVVSTGLFLWQVGWLPDPRLSPTSCPIVMLCSSLVLPPW